MATTHSAVAQEQSLVPTFIAAIGGIEQTCVDARFLHAYLQNGDMFAHWINARLQKYGFEQGTDYELIAWEKTQANFASEKNEAKTQGRGGHNKKDYRISLDMAKELSMVENNDQGRAARKYFIACERQLMLDKTTAATPYSVQPGQSLSAEQANWLRDFLTSCARTLETGQRGEFMVQGWSKLKSHFGCSYRNIAAHEWVEAASLLARHAAEWGIQRASTPQQPQQPQQSAPVALLENPMAPIYDARRRTLRQAMVLLCNGRQTNMARRLGIGASYVSRMLSTGRSAKGIGGDYAREIEQKLGLPALWLDDERNASATSIVSAQPCANDAVPESARRSKELRILLGGIERMAPVKDRELTEAIQLARSISLELANDLDALQHELASA